VDSERAETYLRDLAEAELRRLLRQPGGEVRAVASAFVPLTWWTS
jgi:hypothetical protein